MFPCSLTVTALVPPTCLKIPSGRQLKVLLLRSMSMSFVRPLKDPFSTTSKPLLLKSSFTRLPRLWKRPSGSVLNLLPFKDTVRRYPTRSKPSNTPAGSSVKFIFSKCKCEEKRPHHPGPTRNDVLRPSISSCTPNLRVPSPANMPTGSELKLWFLRSRKCSFLRSAKGP